MTMKADSARVLTARPTASPNRGMRTASRAISFMNAITSSTHASIATTLNIYTDVVDASHRRAVELVEERLFTELDPNGPKLAIEPAVAAAVSAGDAES